MRNHGDQVSSEGHRSTRVRVQQPGEVKCKQPPRKIKTVAHIGVRFFLHGTPYKYYSNACQ
jgi:hypothetical protein